MSRGPKHIRGDDSLKTIPTVFYTSDAEIDINQSSAFTPTAI